MKKDAKELKIVPLGNRVLIKELEEKESRNSGIIIPDTVDQDRGVKRGKIVAAGEGAYEDGKLVPMRVKVGDTVLFQWADKITIEGEEYQLAKESDIVAIIK